jgi:Mg2+ and Co2+ transporter CorA
LQRFAAGFTRFASAVRSATVGIETLPGITPRAAAELNDYADLVEDFEDQLYERRRWLSDITHDFANALAQRRSDQISRLTVASMIFLPRTALTGFFGMNFQWLNDRIASRSSFLTLGLALPALGMIGRVAWLARRGLMRLDLWRGLRTAGVSRAPLARRDAAPPQPRGRGSPSGRPRRGV